ncbi:hypothetical protein M3Y96_00776900 [Aphelenchoides besseyi]|nr:hypothetical protein M3Y96_00776900 [Aphelenchoides besseyi]
MVAIKTLLTFCVLLAVVISGTEAFHSRYFDSYEDDWRFLRRPPVPVVAVSHSVEVPVDDEPVHVVPASVEVSEEDPRYYSRPSYGRRSYYEPRLPVASPISYGYRPRYGKK